MVLVEACRRVVAESPLVEVRQEAVERLASRLALAEWREPPWRVPGWNAGDQLEKVVAWALAFGAVNFALLPEPGRPAWRPEAGASLCPVLSLLRALAAAIDRGWSLHEAAFLEGLTLDELHAALRPAPDADPLPMMEARLAALHELGRAYAGNGGPLGLIARGRRSAWALVQVLAAELPRWDDARTWRGLRLRFLGRAQVTVSMLASLVRDELEVERWDDLDRLPGFSEPHVPRLLRAEGVLVLAPELAGRIEAGAPLLPNGEEEVAIRAATLDAVDRLVSRLRPLRPELTPLRLSGWLWGEAVRRDEALPPPHRTRCLDY